MTSESAGLERRYQRLLTWYPRAYRREHEQEILGVLMAGAAEGQRRPGPREAADLIRSASLMRLRPGASRPPRPVLAAVRLMCLGAVLEVVGWATYVLTAGDVRSVMLQRDPSQWAATHAHLVAIELVGPIAAGLWLWLAWAIRRGHNWGRVAFAGWFCLTSMSLLAVLALGGAVYFPAELAATAVIWVTQLVVMVLIAVPRSQSYYLPRTLSQ